MSRFHDLCENHMGKAVDTKDGHFTIKLTGYKGEITRPVFAVIDKRTKDHKYYELIRGSENTWGLTDLSTGEWHPVYADKGRYFPDLDRFFKTSEEMPIHQAGKELCRLFLTLDNLPPTLPPPPPPMSLMLHVVKMIQCTDQTDEELTYWKKWFRYGLEAIPPEKRDRHRHMWMYSFAYDEK